jgi:hypothetical protein
MTVNNRWYTVVALYEDNFQRYCTSVLASSPEEAETLAQERCRNDNGFSPDVGDLLLIAGVLEGQLSCVA